VETADNIIKKEVSIANKYVCKLANKLIAESITIYKNKNRTSSLLKSKSTVLHVVVNNTDIEMLKKNKKIITFNLVRVVNVNDFLGANSR
jgi:hypothetical protein